MKAMILSAGYGKRLHPLTEKCPKPLLKIGKETLLSNTIKFLKYLGTESIVINVHYLSEQIIDYLDQNKFDLPITIVKEEEKILDTGGGILNAIKHFSNEPFITINPDTIWSLNYEKEFKLMKKNFFNYNQKCSLLIVNKKKSSDQSFKGDFNLENNLITKKNNTDLKYIYTGLQIVKTEVFEKTKDRIFSINKIWDKLIDDNELNAHVSKINFLHVSNLNYYNDLLKNIK